MNFGGRQPIALNAAELGRDVRLDTVAGVTRCLAVPLEPRRVFLQALADGIGAAPVVASIVTREVGKPRAGCLLRLSERQDVFAIGIGDVIGRAHRAIAAAMLRAVVACNPGAALGAFPVAHRQPLGDRAPVGLPSRLEPRARSARVELGITKSPCHRSAP